MVASFFQVSCRSDSSSVEVSFLDADPLRGTQWESESHIVRFTSDQRFILEDKNEWSGTDPSFWECNGNKYVLEEKEEGWSINISRDDGSIEYAAYFFDEDLLSFGFLRGGHLQMTSTPYTEPKSVRKPLAEQAEAERPHPALKVEFESGGSSD